MDQKGDVTVVYTHSSQDFNFSNTNLTLAIPTNQPAQTLPATRTVVNQLVARGYVRSHFTDILIGYQWTGSSNDQQVAYYEPTYYVDLKGEYVDYQSWLNHSSERSRKRASGHSRTPSNDDSTRSESEPTQ